MLNIKPGNKSSSNKGNRYSEEQSPQGLASATTSIRPRIEQDARSEFPLKLPTNRKITYDTSTTKSTPVIGKGFIHGGLMDQPGANIYHDSDTYMKEEDEDFAIVTTQDFDEDNYELRLCKVEGSMRSTNDSLQSPELLTGSLPFEACMQSETHLKPKRLYLPVEIPAAPKRPKKIIEGAMHIEENIVSPDAIYSTPPKKSRGAVFFGKMMGDSDKHSQTQKLADQGELQSGEINKKTCMELRTGLVKNSSEYLDIMLSEEF
jgi:hypothetical protein